MARRAAVINGSKFEVLTDSLQNFVSGWTEVRIGKSNAKNAFYRYTKQGSTNWFFVRQAGLQMLYEPAGTTAGNRVVYRLPDEAFVSWGEGQRTVLHVLEKKFQTVEGSVETKLQAAPTLREEYRLMFGGAAELMDGIKGWDVRYALVMSDYFRTKMECKVGTTCKYHNLRRILQQQNIGLLYGEEEDYWLRLREWLGFAGEGAGEVDELGAEFAGLRVEA